MDLRVVKTKKVIKEAFFEIRKKTPLERIIVLDLCKRALINKSTFYNHYADIFALSDELENELIDECFNSFKERDCLFSNTKLFLEQVQLIIESRKEELCILFDGRTEVMFSKLEKQLRNYYTKKNDSKYDEILITFIISGAMHSMQILLYEGKYDNDTLISRMSEVIGDITS